MSNEQPHINPWAEKLQQAPMPDADVSWKGMEHLLNQHLPVEEKEKKRRFFFILFPIILLSIGLVLLGGYLYSTSKQQAKQNQRAADNSAVATHTTGVDTTTTFDKRPLQAPANSAVGKVIADALTADTTTGNHSIVEQAKLKEYTGDTDKNDQRPNSKASSVKEITSVNNTYTSPGRSVSNKEKVAAATASGAVVKKTTTSSAQEQIAKRYKGAGMKKNKRKAIVHKGTSIKDRENEMARVADQRKDLRINVVAADRNEIGTAGSISVRDNSQMYTYPLAPLRKPVDPLHRLILNENIDQLRSSVMPDSALPAMKKKGDEVVRKGWTFGVGVNHFVRINNQQSAPYKGNAITPDSEGLTGKITDYLPVPQARYHFNNNLYVQGELQFNAPQFTQPVQLEQRSYSDGAFDVNDTAYLQKLTYFNLPLSIHYSPLKRIYIGAGVQFSQLNNAIVLYEKTKTWGGVQLPDSSFKSSKQERIKGDTLFQKLHTAEFRLLADVSYQAGPIGVGLRYNHALRNLVKVPVSGGVVTQARNSSLQLYLRYRFLDKRKTIKPKSK